MSVARHIYITFLGTVRAHFERSTLPEHAGTRTIVLRILDAPSSVKCVVSDYDYYILPPTSGNLLHGYYLNGKRGARGLLRPWSANLDVGIGKATRMFSLLWPPLSGKDSNATTWKVFPSTVRTRPLNHATIKNIISFYYSLGKKLHRWSFVSNCYKVTDLTFVSGAGPIANVNTLDLLWI